MRRFLLPNRVFVAVATQDLPQAIPRNGSWFLGVLIGPGDTTQELPPWAGTRRPDLGRIRSSLRTGTDPVAAMRAWVQAGLPPPLFEDEVDAWPRFHRRFGAPHAIQVYLDHVARPASGLAGF